MSTLPACFYSIMAIDVGHLCMEAAENQGLWKKNMPTTSDWVRSNWYVFFVVALVIALSIVGITLSAVRWCRRIEHRHKREERNKRVNGMFRLVSASFHGTLSRRGSAANLAKSASEPDELSDEDTYNSRSRPAAASASPSRRQSYAHVEDNNNNNNNNTAADELDNTHNGRSSSNGSARNRRRGKAVETEGDEAGGDDGCEGAQFQSGSRASSRGASVERPQAASSRAPPTGDEAQPRRKGRRPMKARE